MPLEVKSFVLALAREAKSLAQFLVMDSKSCEQISDTGGNDKMWETSNWAW